MQRIALNPGSSPSFVSLDKNVFCKVQHIIRLADVTKPPRLLKRLPQCHNMIRNKRCTSVWLGYFSNYFNENSSTLFLKTAKLDKFVIDTGQQYFQTFGSWQRIVNFLMLVYTACSFVVSMSLAVCHNQIIEKE